MTNLPELELPTLNLAEALSYNIASDFKWLNVSSFSEKKGDAEVPSIVEQLKLPSTVEFISNYECEEGSGFGSDILWGYTHEDKEEALILATPVVSNAGAFPGATVEKKSGNYHQQARSKGGKPGAAKQGELGSNTTGVVINLKEKDYDTDWYELLGIEDEDCGEEELKAYFRKACLATHPDKHQGNDEAFKEVQKGFSILSNYEARRQYDSSRPFDDSLPPESLNFEDKPKDFAPLFKPFFERNAKWSTSEVTVSIGDENTPIADVRKFYDFWMNFRSWRDFSHEAELEDINENASRYEKRHFQQENERILNGLKRTEQKRIRNLVDRAMAADPRLKAEAKRVEEERLAAIEERKRMRFKIDDTEKFRLEEEAKQKEIAAAEEAKKLSGDLQEIWKASKQSVIDYFTKHNVLDEEAGGKSLLADKINRPIVDWIFQKVNKNKKPDEVAKTLTSFENPSNVEELVNHFNATLIEIQKSVKQTRYGEPVNKNTKFEELPIKKQ